MDYYRCINILLSTALEKMFTHLFYRQTAVWKGTYAIHKAKDSVMRIKFLKSNKRIGHQIERENVVQIGSSQRRI